MVEELQEQIRKAFLSKDVIYVNSDGISISTINGDELLAQADLVSLIYSYTLDLLSKSFPKVYELRDKKIAISANKLTSENNKFRLHFDRNQITVVIYLACSTNFPLILYPLIRKDPRVFKVNTNKRFNLNSSREIKIYPKPGLAVIFWGRRTLHGVIFEDLGTGCIDERLSLQFGFDLSEFNYDGEFYYGKKSDASLSSVAVSEN